MTSNVSLTDSLSVSFLGVVAGPLFWVFAEDAVAIIGACLPTLAPLWSGRSLPMVSKVSSYLKAHIKGLGKRSGLHPYNDLGKPDRNTNRCEGASDFHLVAPLGLATNIFADEVALDDSPREGIRVHTALSSDHAR